LRENQKGKRTIRTLPSTSSSTVGVRVRWRIRRHIGPRTYPCKEYDKPAGFSYSRRGSAPAREWSWQCARSPKRAPKPSLRQARNTGENGGLWVWAVRWPTKPHTKLCGPWGAPHSNVPWGHHSTRLVRLRMSLGLTRSGRSTPASHESNQGLRRRQIPRKERGPPTEGLVVHERDARCPRDRKAKADAGLYPVMSTSAR
jgi:hypothetical protein